MTFIERNSDLILGAVFASPVYLALTAAWVRGLTRFAAELEEENARLRSALELAERKAEWLALDAVPDAAQEALEIERDAPEGGPEQGREP